MTTPREDDDDFIAEMGRIIHESNMRRIKAQSDRAGNANALMLLVFVLWLLAEIYHASN